MTRIIGYCDFQGKEIDDQILVANELGIENLIIRQIGVKKIYDINDQDCKEILRSVKSSKKSIYALDPEIMTYDLYKVKDYEKALSQYEKTFIIASKLKVDYVLYRLPKIIDILNEFVTVEKQLNKFIELAKKSGRKILIYHNQEKTNVLAYIMKKFQNKDLGLIYNPKQATLNGDSPTTGYRLLRDFFDCFVAADVDKNNNPELLGYGRVKIIDLFKRMGRDNYRGNVIIDNSFSDFIDNNQIKKVPWYKKLLKKSDTFDDYLKGYSARIFPDEEDRIADIFDIYQSQIKALKIMFNLRD
ncbi:MAG: hypothetical protein RBQ97_05430 [Acholeplasma sp.]|nr:hypothetical protein [Acholeplasma sp.]